MNPRTPRVPEPESSDSADSDSSPKTTAPIDELPVPFNGTLGALPNTVSNLLVVQQHTDASWPDGLLTYPPNGTLVVGRGPIGFRADFTGADTCMWDPPQAEPIPSDTDLGPTVAISVGSQGYSLRRTGKAGGFMYLWFPNSPWNTPLGDESWTDGGISLAGHDLNIDVPPSFLPTDLDFMKSELQRSGLVLGRWQPDPTGQTFVVAQGSVTQGGVVRPFLCELADDGVADIALTEGGVPPEHALVGLMRLAWVEADVPGVGVTYVVAFRNVSWSF
jgi:hypothetical protein